MVDIHFVEELVELGAGDRETSSSERQLQLVLVEFAVVIAIDALEELPKLLFRMLHKDLELWKGG